MQTELLDRPVLILDYGQGDADKLPASHLAGPYDPDLLTRLDNQADGHPIRQLIAQTTS